MRTDGLHVRDEDFDAVAVSRVIADYIVSTAT